MPTVFLSSGASLCWQARRRAQGTLHLISSGHHDQQLRQVRAGWERTAWQKPHYGPCLHWIRCSHPLRYRISDDLPRYCPGIADKGLPKEFTSTEDRPVGDLKVLYDVNSKISIYSEICGVKSGPPKNVMLMTSMVPDLARSRDDTRRLYLTCLYNYTMGGTDRVDQLIGNMSCRWKSDRWTMNTFAFMLDTACVNSRTVALLQDG